MSCNHGHKIAELLNCLNLSTHAKRETARQTDGRTNDTVTISNRSQTSL